MSILGHYFVGAFLRHMGWPRKLGLLRGEGYDTTIVDGAVAQMVDWAATLGATRPRIALSMIAEMFQDRDWNSESAPQIAQFVTNARSNWDRIPTAAPRDVVAPIAVSKHFGKVISSKDFQDPRIGQMLEQVVLEALLWGLANPDRLTSWYSQTRERHHASLDRLHGAGLAVDELPSLEDWAAQCEDAIHDYELNMGALPAPHPKLLADATVLGLKLG
jgi:hypothetical protein